MSKFDFDNYHERRGFDGEKWNIYSKDILPMWVADSDFLSPEPIRNALIERAKHGMYGYTDNADPSFGKAAARWMSVRFGWEANPEQVAFTPGVCAALALHITTFTHPGDNVVTLTPIYPPFIRVTKNNGRNFCSSSLVKKGNSYEIDFDDLENKLSDPKTRLFLLCNPHNPTGKVFSKNELLRIGELCLKYNVIVFSDEIHCDYVYPGHTHIPFPSLSKELAEISLVAINPSKTFNIADLHTGAVLSSSHNLFNQYANATSKATLSKHSFGVIAFVAAYTKCDDYADAVRDYIQSNMEFAVDYFKKNIPQINAYMPESTYLLWLNCEGFNFKNHTQLVDFFLKKAKVALNSGADFGIEGNNYMRMNLACPRSTLEEGLARIKKAIGA